MQSLPQTISKWTSNFQTNHCSAINSVHGTTEGSGSKTLNRCINTAPFNLLAHPPVLWNPDSGYSILPNWKVHPSRYQVSLAVTWPNLAKAKVVTQSGNRLRGCASIGGYPSLDEAFEGSMVDSKNALSFLITERTC